MIYGAAIAAIGLLGGSFNITLPADEKVAELEMQSTAQFEEMEKSISQNWQQREVWQQQQQQYHRQKEIEAIQWRLRWITNEINRINQIPQYLNRPINPQEQWQVEQLQQEWAILQDRLHQLTQ